MNHDDAQAPDEIANGDEECGHGPRGLPRVDVCRGCEMRREADEFFGTQDRLGDDDPWARSRS